MTERVEPLLVDNFNRVIDYVRISVTDRCNLRCRYCVDGRVNFVAHDEILRYEEIVRFVRLCAGLGVSKIRLTGGEPLTRKGVAGLLGEIRRIGGIEDISLTTNGVLLGRQIMDLTEAGLKRVNISLDSLKRERFAYITGVDALDEVFMSIEKAMYAGLRPIKINTVIIKDFNDDEVLDFARLAAKWGLDVRFIEFMPFGEFELWNSSRILPSAEAESWIRDIFELDPAEDEARGPAKMFRIKGTSGRVGFISPVSSHICSRCNRIRLTAQGMIRPCLFSDVEYDVKALLRGGAGSDEIRDFIARVVRSKPERKGEMGQMKKCQRNLREIGG